MKGNHDNAGLRTERDRAGKCQDGGGSVPGPARYLRSAPEDAWSGPTGCARWTLRDLAGHAVGEAVWFPNLVRGVTQGEPPLPANHYESLKVVPAAQLADTMEEAARSIPPAIDAATADQLHKTVDVGFTKLPLWRATNLALIESVLHNWDASVGAMPPLPYVRPGRSSLLPPSSIWRR